MTKPQDESKDILTTARSRFKLAEEAFSTIRKTGLDDLKFRAGEQWPQEVVNERNADGRPCLTINRIPQFVRQITNDQRQNRPSIKVFPVDDKADPQTAKVFAGIIKHIEYNSNAEVAYDTALEGAVIKGFGYWRILTEYIDPMSFEQEIKIARIRNHFSVLTDPNSKEPDGSDANWGFIFEDLANDDFDAEYGKDKRPTQDDWELIGNTMPDWATSTHVRVAEYFYKDFESKDIVLLSNGQVVEKSKFTREVEDKFKAEGITVDKERNTVVPVVKWCVLNGVHILKETIWPGQWIPIIPVIGDELDVNGELILEGVVRHAKDSQRMYNYWASTETETIALSPRAPYIAAEGQIPPQYEHQWKTANRKNHAFLTYKAIALNGQPVGAPQRQVYEAPVQAITNARAQASEDLKATTGIYDAALGNRSNEQSGVAIQRRNNQSQTSNFHFFDNLTRSMRHTGRMLIDLIPKIYDTPRIGRIIGEDGEQEIVKLNQIFEKDGKNIQFNLGYGRYDCVVETGPSFATRRQEAAASMNDLAGRNPKLLDVAGDLMFKNMDWPGADEIAERWKKMLPPPLQDQSKAPQIPPEAKAKMDQMGQMIDQLTGHLKEKTELLSNKKMELESRERIEFAKMEVDLKKKVLDMSHEDAMVGFTQELDKLNQRLGLVGINQPISDYDNDADDQNQQGQQLPQQNQNFNGSGSNNGAAIQQNQQNPTGGETPG